MDMALQHTMYNFPKLNRRNKMYNMQKHCSNNYRGYQTPSPLLTVGKYSRFANNNDQIVEYEYDAPLICLESYFEENKIKDGHLYDNLTEYKKNNIDSNDKTIVDFLNSLNISDKFNSNNVLYEESIKFLKYLVFNNKLHKKKYENLKVILTTILFESNSNKIDASKLEEHEVIDFFSYNFNNFRKDKTDSVLNELFEKNGAMTINKDLNIDLKLSDDDEIKSYSQKKAGDLLTLQREGLKVEIVNREIDHENKRKHYISIFDLLFVMGKKFKPYILEEYFSENGNYYQNRFKPSRFIMLTGEPSRKPKSILDLLFNLVDYNNERLHYVLNWLAYFFKYLKKSQVALAFIGDEGPGKGILFFIIKKLFGEEYCITINDEILNSRFKAKFTENKLFYNFDEIKFNTSKKNNSYLKALITNKSISVEEKYVTIEKEIELYGQCIFSSNDLKALYLHPSDRRYTVMNTGTPLSKNNYLNFGNYANLEIAIDEELEDFAKYLKNYDVDITLANTALDTPEKRMIINASKDHLEDFHAAIINKKESYFEELNIENSVLFHNIISDFKRNRINRVNIAKAYNALFGRNISTKALLEKLREFQPYDTYESINYHSGSAHYYQLP